MKIFHGWYIVAVAFVCYGFGISPAYYSWGYYFSFVEADLGYTKADLGMVFGLFTFLYSGVGPLVGYLQNRIGVRSIMTFGSILAAIGFVLVSRADSRIDFLIGFSIFGGVGIGMSTIIPTQTLGQNWFLKRRALAIAIIMCAGGLVGKLVPMINNWVVESFESTWRAGWLVTAGISLSVGLLAALFVRDTPEQMGLVRDGAPANPTPEKDGSTAPLLKETSWSAIQAILTPQFFLITLAGIGYAVPWGVVIAHGVTHMVERGIEHSIAGPIIGTAALISIGGRLTGMLGDTVNPRHVIVVGLLLEGIGMGGFYFASSALVANLSLGAVAIGFGCTYICIPVLFSDYFGRRAFGTTAGSRMLITGIFNGLGPWLTGVVADRSGYFVPFMILAGLCFVGSFATFICRHPGAPPERSEQPESA